MKSEKDDTTRSPLLRKEKRVKKRADLELDKNKRDLEPKKGATEETTDYLY